mmetsp:Transcript_8804/g.21074  ORF Transcript_8804/g.21074 Transcript_8804/m.21074 type:complete len:548 (+) Transcript_8804:86-1729(+)
MRFIYRGEDRCEIPRGMTHLVVHSSISEVRIRISDNDPLWTVEDFRIEQIVRKVRTLAAMGVSMRNFTLCHSIAEVTFQEGVRIVGAMAFVLCCNLLRIDFPRSVEKIGRAAFLGCFSLVEVEFQQGLKTVSYMAFSGCESLKRVSLPSTVEVIGKGAFAWCNSLEIVELREGLKTLGEEAFCNCVSLARISVPSSVETISYCSFKGCEKLTDVQLRHGLKTIENDAFALCISMCAVFIPSSTVLIRSRAFAGCKSLLGIEFEGSLSLGLGCFTGCTALVTVSLYTRIPDDLEFDACFEDCTSLRLPVSRPLSILQDRFADLPIHEGCYHASTTTVDEVSRRIKATSMFTDEKNAKDCFGMTPFHIVATSPTLSADLLELLLDEYPVDVLGHKDVNDTTMMDYLLKNGSPRAVPLIKMVLERAVLAQMPRFGLGLWRSELSLQVESMDWNGDFEVRRRCLDGLLAALSRCVTFEGSTVLELALWKWKTKSSLNDSGNKRRKVDRECCGTLNGADVVIPNVVEYLWNDRKQSSDVSMVPFDLSWMIKS